MSCFHAIRSINLLNAGKKDVEDRISFNDKFYDTNSN